MIPLIDKLKVFTNTKGKGPKGKISLGLDIGSSAIKVVKLKFDNGLPELSGTNLLPVASTLDAILKQLAQSEDIKSANISVSGQSTITRYANFPKMNLAELKQALKFEVQKLIPFAINEINLDSYILKPDLPDNKMLLLLAAVKKDFIGPRLKLLEDCGIKANIVDIDSLALVNAFNFNISKDNVELKDKTVALLNIGAAISSLNLVEGSLPCLSRDIKTAGGNFTKKIADVLGVDLQAAEDIKINPKKEQLTKIAAALESVINNLAAEIRTSFDYYESQGSSTVTKIYLSGGGSLLSGLKEALSSILDITVEYWDSFKNIGAINAGDTADSAAGAAMLCKKEELSAKFAVAVGLALRQ